MIDDLPYVLATTSAGKIMIIAAPPLMYRYNIVDSFINQDVEDITENLGI